MSNNLGNCSKIPDPLYTSSQNLILQDIAVLYHAICNPKTTYSPVSDYSISCACMTLGLRGEEVVAGLNKLANVDLLNWDCSTDEIAFLKWAEVNSQPERLHQILKRKVKGIRSNNLRSYALTQINKSPSRKGKWVPKNIWAILSRSNIPLELKVLYFKLWTSDLTSSAGVFVATSGYIRRDFLYCGVAMGEEQISLETLVKGKLLLRAKSEFFILDWFRYQHFENSKAIKTLADDIKLIKSKKLRRIVEERAKHLLTGLNNNIPSKEMELSKSEANDDKSKHSNRTTEKFYNSKNREPLKNKKGWNKNTLGIIFEKNNMMDLEFLEIIGTYSEEDVRATVKYIKETLKRPCYTSIVLETLKTRIDSNDLRVTINTLEKKIGCVYRLDSGDLLRLEKKDGRLIYFRRDKDGVMTSKPVEDHRKLLQDIQEERLKEMPMDAWEEESSI